jgi:hypothetical protein
VIVKGWILTGKLLQIAIWEIRQQRRADPVELGHLVGYCGA